MPTRFTGQGEYDKAMQTLKDMHGKEWLGPLAMRISAGGMKLVADEFNTSTDPYGKEWVPLQRPRRRDLLAASRTRRSQAKLVAKHGTEGGFIRGPRVLQDTGRMRSSVGASPQGHSARVVIPTWYAIVHQKGAVIPPHSRLARYSNTTYRVNRRFASAKDAAKAARAGKFVQVNRWIRTYSRGIKIPQRMMLPEDDRPLPATWQAMINTETGRLMRQRFGARVEP